MTFIYIENKKYILLHTIVVLFLSLITCGNFAYSQQEDLQSARHIKTIPTDALNSISEALKLADNIRRTQPLKFQQILKNLAIKNNFTKEQLHLFNFLKGYDHTFNGRYNKAEKQFSSILASNTNKLINFRTSYTLVNIYAAKKEWFKGLALINKNIKASELIDNNFHYQAHLTATIIFYKKMKQYELSLYYIKELLAQALSPNLNCIAKQLAIESKFHLNQLSSSDPVIYTALNSCEKNNDIMVSSIIRVYQARAFLAEQNINGAINSLLPYIEAVKSTHYPELITGVNNILAQAYWQTNDITNSKYYAEQAALTNTSNNNVNQSAKTYKVLYQIAKKENKLHLALSYHEKYAAFDKIDSDDIKNKHLSFQLAQNKHLVQQSQIALLSEKNSLLSAEQTLAETKVNNRQLVIILLTFIIIVLTLGGLRLWRTHKRVKQLAEYDPLTGIFNRGHFTQVTLSALKYCQSAEQDLSVIMFDLDHFKKINDSFGHLSGDWALKAVTKACEKLGRQNDIFARLGGEEFCIVLPSCNIDVAMLRAEACRAAIEAITTEASGCDFTITASFGVTDAQRSGFTLEKLIGDADFAAYESKHADRNRVTMFTAPEKTETEKLDTSWGYN
ncbi:GGDEF domain-containing protein [Colwellia sp. 75C3]|uniref:tetratricopeptide repeat-containing diguanylate cyclase n=1 Tax=Colwellia sp. 75C3 TaxID=888425 RepID=UPI000C334699|nr:GGDEF domain-containing protein [Colwellia sp. 75C3]PKG83193.1 GGDEF domain-containing protein [Colwellia sp. 75C3]